LDGYIQKIRIASELKSLEVSDEWSWVIDIFSRRRFQDYQKGDS
jgi:hypothetical protein